MQKPSEEARLGNNKFKADTHTHSLILTRSLTGRHTDAKRVPGRNYCRRIRTSLLFGQRICRWTKTGNKASNTARTRVSSPPRPSLPMQGNVAAWKDVAYSPTRQSWPTMSDTAVLSSR